jgi:23S rRNA pseudouridine1911/1915/1917 synthase
MPETIAITPDLAGATLAAILRKHLPGQSWTAIRRFIASRRVCINGDLALDPARRLRESDSIELLERSLPKPPREDDIVIRHLDEHIVVVEKPAGIPTVRHPAEYDWSERRRALTPTLDDLVLLQINRGTTPAPRRPRPRLRIVHRLDKETSGLVVFARSVVAERGLGKQFKVHTVVRRYLAIVHGALASQRIASCLVRDRGDGRRGSTTLPHQGKEAVTHVEAVESLPGYSLVSCRLETGRTHQIRIHLAELGHPVCGEKVYQRKIGAAPEPDTSGALRLALHAAELGFVHPVTGTAIHWSMPLPPDLQAFLDQLRRRN